MLKGIRGVYFIMEEENRKAIETLNLESKTLKDLQRECAVIAFNRKKITMDDLRIPDSRTFIKDLYSEIREAELSAMNNELVTCNDNNKVTGLPSEIADIVIICLTWAYCLNFDLQKEVINKVKFNKDRND